MKKLSKLLINSEKILKDDELRSLTGGECWYCRVYCPDEIFGGLGCGESPGQVALQCTVFWQQYGTGCWCHCE